MTKPAYVNQVIDYKIAKNQAVDNKVRHRQIIKSSFPLKGKTTLVVDSKRGRFDIDNSLSPVCEQLYFATTQTNVEVSGPSFLDAIFPGCRKMYYMVITTQLFICGKAFPNINSCRFN